MRVAVGLTALALVLGALTAPAAAAVAPLSAADRRAIGDLVDRFVKDAVLRENLAAAWEMAGPDLRGGTTRAAWIAGTGVTVQAFPALGRDFRNAWTVDAAEPGHAQLSLILNPRPGHPGFYETAMTVDVRKLHGRWLVDLFYPTAVFRTGTGHSGSCGSPDCAISGPNDFRAGASGSAYGNSSSRISGHWLLVGIGAVGGALLLIPLGIWVRVRRRDRRALAGYAATNPESWRLPR